MIPILYSIYGRIVLLETCVPLLSQNKKMMAIVCGIGVEVGGSNTGKGSQEISKEINREIVRELIGDLILS